MTVTAAPACKAALTQATALWPNRRRSSDGILSSDAHKLQNPTSDHDYGLAWDLSHDPDSGCDAHAEVRALVARRDPRVKYVISRGRIWSAARADEGWRIYTGSNPHNLHAHVSIHAAHRDSTGPWFRPVKAQAAVKPTPITVQEDTMSPAQEAKLDKVIDLLEALVRPRRADKVDHDPKVHDLGDILTKVERETP